MAGRTWISALCLLLALFNGVKASVTGKRVLVLLQDVESKSKYSLFFDALSAQGFNLEFKAHKDSTLKLKQYDTWLYDHLALFSPKAEGFGGSIDLQNILDFVDSGHNVLVAVNSDVSETLRNFALECGVELDEKGTKVVDYFHAASVGKADPSLIFTSNIVNATVFTGKAVKDPVLFRGIGSAVDYDSDLVSVLLSAPETAYSADRLNGVSEPVLVTGKSISLVSALQARNNARVVIAGSIDMFSNEFLEAPVGLAAEGQQIAAKAGNQDFCIGVARWAFQDSGVLRSVNVRHRMQDSGEQPHLYRVNDLVEFLVDIEEYNHGAWGPYKAGDVQVEFVMLNPYVRLPLTHNGKGTFSVKFQVPDVYGVFKYVIDYKALGYSYIKETLQVPVRPFKHNEYERFLVCAYPYYASAISSMAAFFLVGWFFLYTK